MVWTETLYRFQVKLRFRKFQVHTFISKAALTSAPSTAAYGSVSQHVCRETVSPRHTRKLRWAVILYPNSCLLFCEMNGSSYPSPNISPRTLGLLVAVLACYQKLGLNSLHERPEKPG